MSEVQVTRNDDQRRYEAHIAGELAGFTQFSDDGEIVLMPHTEVGEAFGGKGVGGALARTALDDIRAAGRKVNPTCPFIAGWIDKHPDYQDLLQ